MTNWAFAGMATILLMAGNSAYAQEASSANAAKEPAAPMSVPNTPAPAALGYGSYKNTAPGSFSGKIAGNYSAENLVGREVVDGQGNEIGQISDLLIGSDGSIQNVLVDVGGFLGIGMRTVALDLNQVQLTKNDADKSGNLVISMTKQQVEALPTVEQTEAGWSAISQQPAVPSAAAQ